MRYLPDTNVFVAWTVRGDPAVTARMAKHRRAIGLSAIVAHELYFGAFNSRRVDRNLREIESFGLPLLAFDRADARAAGEIRTVLKRRGTPIGPYDVLIAAQALVRDLVLVTANVGEFSRIEGLRIENWLEM